MVLGWPLSLVRLRCYSRLATFSPKTQSDLSSVVKREGIMWRSATVILLAMAVPGSFPATDSSTLRQHYGQPISETFLVSSGITATATYGPNGETCELLIAPEQTSTLIKNWPGSATIPYETLKQTEDELIPTSERGKSEGGGILNFVCLPYNDCAGSSQDWEKIVEYSNAGKNGAARYAVIQWRRNECQHRTP